MPFPFDKYPWLNFQELNLAYFIKHFREIFEQWNTLLNKMYSWKDATDADLAEWKTTVEAGISSWETGLLQSMEDWKDSTEADISTWEAATLSSLDAWKSAATAVFEQIRTEAAASAQAAAGSATAAAGSATAAQTALAGAQAAQAAAEAAAAGIQSELSQIQTNTADIADLKTQINNQLGTESIVIDSVAGYTPINGFITQDNLWNNVSTTQYVIIPIEQRGGKFSITKGSSISYYAFLTDFTTHNTGESPDFCADPYNRRKTVQATPLVDADIPDDARYMYLAVGNNLPSVFNITIPATLGTVTQQVEENSENIDLLIPRVNTLETKVFNLENDVDSLDERVLELENGASIFERDNLDDLPVFTGNISSEGKWNYLNNSNYQYVLVPAMGGMIVSATPPEGSSGIRIAVLRDYIEPVTGDDVLLSKNSAWNTPPVWINAPFTAILPEDTKYVFVVTKYGAEGYDHTPATFSLEKGINTTVRWLAMGDSITYGYYSTPTTGDDGESHNDKKTYGWAYQVANFNKWELTNIAIGGTGYLNKAGTDTEGYYIARNTDFTPYDLITIAYGINDWKAPWNNIADPMGSISDPAATGTDIPATIISAMKTTIEAIMANNPACKIIVLLPLNIRGYASDRFLKSTQYARGTSAHPKTGTLDSFADKMIEVCNLYGIQYIDLTRYSVLNTENMITLLPDGVHPSLEGHRLLARELAKKITF